MTDLRSIQAPLKELYRNQPETARVTLKAEGKLGEGVSYRVDTGRTLVIHPARRKFVTGK